MHMWQWGGSHVAVVWQWGGSCGSGVGHVWQWGGSHVAVGCGSGVGHVWQWGGGTELVNYTYLTANLPISMTFFAWTQVDDQFLSDICL